jgi:hypothetical protein
MNAFNLYLNRFDAAEGTFGEFTQIEAQHSVPTG